MCILEGFNKNIILHFKQKFAIIVKIHIGNVQKNDGLSSFSFKNLHFSRIF